MEVALESFRKQRNSLSSVLWVDFPYIGFHTAMRVHWPYLNKEVPVLPAWTDAGRQAFVLMGRWGIEK